MIKEDLIKISVNGRNIGSASRCYIIAEMSANHAQDINNAIKIIHKAKDAGADCIKIQTYTPDTITIDSNKKIFQINHGKWNNENLYNLYEKAYTPWQWQKRLKDEAESIGIDCLFTPFDKTAVDFLESIDASFYKISSFEFNDIPLIKYVASKGKPIIMSTGLANLGEIEEAIKAANEMGNNKICLLKCSSNYPAVPEDMNLKTIKHMKKTFGVPIGLSDHSLGSVVAIAAVVLGAKIIEKHFCISRSIETPDSSFSMEPDEFKQMVQDIRQAEKTIGHISYELSEDEKSNRVFRKSIFVVKDIKNGELFSDQNIKIIRPGYGLEPKYYDKIIGKQATKDLEKGTPFEWGMMN